MSFLCGVLVGAILVLGLTHTFQEKLIRDLGRAADKYKDAEETFNRATEMYKEAKALMENYQGQLKGP